MTRWIGTGAGLLSLPSSSVIPTPPAPTVGTRSRLRPSFTAGATGKCRYRHWDRVVVANRLWCANGWDAPWYTDGTTNYVMGGVAPSTGAAADSGSGSTFATGTALSYYFVGRNTSLQKETAPLVVTHTMTATKDASLTWTALTDAQFDKMAIYRAAQATGTYYLVAEVTMATAAYTDSTPDATLITNRTYVRRYRTTLPPTFTTLARSSNRFFGATGKDALLYYGQVWDVGGEWLLDDFPSAGVTTAGGVFAVAPNDGLGPITAVLEYFEALYVFKRRGCYRVTGRGTDTSPFDTTLVFSDRGCLAPSAWTIAEDTLYFFDERGLCLMTPDGAMIPAAAPQGTRESPLAPWWERINLNAARRIVLGRNLTQGFIVAHVPFDDAPVPEHAVVYDYRKNVYISIDPLSPTCAAGELLDGSGVRHQIVVCDLGLPIEEDVGDADIWESGGTGGTLSAYGTGTLTVAGAGFTTSGSALLGAPVERYSAAGAVLAQNRVVSNTGTALTLQFVDTSTPSASGDTVAVGVIPALWRTGANPFGTPRQKKQVPRLTLQYEDSSSASVLVEDAQNTASDRTLGTITLNDVRGKTLVPVRAFCYRWTLQVSNRAPNQTWHITAAEVEVTTTGEYLA